MILREWCIFRDKQYLLKEWHTIKNKPMTPDNVTHGSNKRVWWICKKGHEWQTQLKSRSNSTTGCPYCRMDELERKRKAGGRKQLREKGEKDIS